MSEITFVCTLIKKALHEAYYFMHSIIGDPPADDERKHGQSSALHPEEKLVRDLDTAKWEVELDWKIKEAKEVIQDNELQATISMLERRISEKRRALQ